MKKLIFIAFIGLASNSWSQKIIQNNQVCDPVRSPYGFEITAVEEFKDTIQLNIRIDQLTTGRDTKTVNITYEESITNESKILKLSHDVGISISIARVVEGGKKYYLYKLHLFKKDGKCWEDLNADGYWNKCNLGTITSGYGMGNHGTSNFTGFSGSISIN